MKRATLKITAALIAALMCLAVLPFGAFAGTITPKEIVSGSCGDDLTWTLDTATGALSITGTGNMTSKPWSGYSSIITTLTLGEGVTSICSDAFYYCEALTAVIGGSGLTSIGDRAFYHCSLLNSIVIPEGVATIGNSAFAYCTSLPSINIPSGVTTIPRWAFYSCGSLASVVIPDSVASIGIEAFHSCNSMTSLSIGSGVTSIGREAFSFCRALASVTIPAGVNSIDYGAFRVCSALTTAVFEGDPPANFGDIVFDNCASGFAIIYNPAYASQWAPNGETTWNGYPIVSGESMSAGQLGNNLAWEFNPATCTLLVTGSGDMAELSSFPWEGFANSVKSIIIGQGVTSIADNAFRGMSMLVNVSAADSVLTIGDSAFRDCTSIVEPQLPGVTTIGDNAFRGCTALERGGGLSVDTIGSYAFCGCTSLFDLRCGELTSIGEGAFKGCASIKSFRLPDGLTAVPDSAFENCTGLYFIGWGLDNRLESVGSRAFAGTGLTVVSFPESVTSIGAGAFADCPTLTTAVFNGNPPASVGSGAFAGAYPKFSVVYISDNASAWSSFGSAWNGYTLLSSTSLVSGVSDGGACWSVNYVTGVMTVYTDYYECGIGTRPGFSVPWDNYRTVPTDIVVGKGVTSIGQYVFQTFTNATTVKLAEGLVSLSAGAFDGCKKLETAVIPETVTTLGYGVFKGCVKLTTAVIPDSVTSCSGAIFEGCASVTTAVVGSGMPWIPEALFKECTSLVSVTIPEGIAAINIVAFYNCTSLASVTIPSSVTSLGDSAFQSCTQLETVALPEGLTSLGSSVFRDCTKLTSVIFRGDPPATVGWDPFYGCTSALTLYYYAAHAYAWAPNGETTWQGRPIVMISGGQQGDIDGDGSIRANAALIVLRLALGLTSGFGSEADVDGDGSVTANDALIILRAALGLTQL